MKTTKRTRLIKKCENLLRKEMVKTIGKCQICGKKKQLGLFHILSKGVYPRIRLHRDNLLLVGWFCCHYPFHHNYYTARDRIIPRIKYICGNNYEQYLKDLNKSEPKLSMQRLEEIYQNLKELYK